MQNKYRIIDFLESESALLQPQSCGHEVISSTNYRWDNNRMTDPHDFFFIQYTLSGHGYYESNNKTYRITPGTAFLAIKSIPYIYYFKDDADRWEFIWLNMRGESGAVIFRELFNEFGPVIRLDRKTLSVQTILKFIQKGRDKIKKDIYQLSGSCYQFLLQLHEDLRTQGSMETRTRIDQITEYMRIHLHESLDVSQLSPVFGYSREHFTRFFRQATGISPGKYLNNLRLERAKELLRSTGDNLDRIAEKSGLTNSNYLCRIFRQKLGITPSQYKESFDATIE
jgi:AraC-like DNA-binding protein